MESSESRRWVLEENELLSCCRSKKFANEMAKLFSPFSSLNHVVEVATDVWFNKGSSLSSGVDVCGWLEAFSAHPQNCQSSSSSNTSAQWNKRE